MARKFSQIDGLKPHFPLIPSFDYNRWPKLLVLLWLKISRLDIMYYENLIQDLKVYY